MTDEEKGMLPIGERLCQVCEESGPSPADEEKEMLPIGERLCQLCEESGPSPAARIVQVKKYLLEHPAIVNYPRVQDKMTPILIGALHDRHQLVKSLILDHQALSHSLTTLGETAMYLSVTYDNIATVQVLLEHGNPQLVHTVPEDGTGNTPLHVAASYGRSPLVALLLQHGALPMSRNVHGNLPVHLACQNGHPSCVEMLLYAHVCLSEKNHDGLTPVQVAHQRNPNHPKVNMILLDFFERESLHRRNAAKKNRQKQRKQQMQLNQLKQLKHQGTTLPVIVVKEQQTVDIDWSSIDPLENSTIKLPPSFANRQTKRKYAIVDWSFRQSGHPGDTSSSLDDPITGYVSRWQKAYALVFPGLLFGDNSKIKRNIQHKVNEFVRHVTCQLPKNTGHFKSIWGHVRQKFLTSHQRHPFQTLKQAIIFLKRLAQDAVRVGDGVKKVQNGAVSSP